MALIDAIDTYYDYVVTRILKGGNGVAALNPDRAFGDIIQAESWPLAESVDSAFYLTIIDQMPDTKFGTLGNQYYRSILQWKWLTSGNNLQPGQTGNNRGDRYRADQAMREELRQANFPQFCPLISLALDGSGNLTRTPYNPIQTCRWTALKFGPRPSGTDDSGVLYGAAAVDVHAFQQPLTQ
jgi:hypothetical protein